jgi:hypothetical protein
MTVADKLSLTTLDGNPIYEETTRVFRGAGFESAIFSADDKVLWVVRHVEGDQIHLERRHRSNWQIEYYATVDEPAPPTSFSLSFHPEMQVLVLWGAAGQDGQWVYWVFDDKSKIQAFEAKQLYSTTPPDFHPAGGEFVVVNDLARLCRYSFPDCDQLETFEWPDMGEYDGIGCCTCYLSDSEVLVSTSSGRLFVVRLGPMRIAEEVQIRGHEPRPTRELYGLNEDGLCADLQWFIPFQTNKLVSVHHQLPCSDHSDEAWKDTLALWTAPGERDRMSTPDNTSPFTSRFVKRLNGECRITSR